MLHEAARRCVASRGVAALVSRLVSRGSNLRRVTLTKSGGVKCCVSQKRERKHSVIVVPVRKGLLTITQSFRARLK